MTQITEKDIDAILNEFPYYAMILDDRHRVVRANTWFAREAADEEDGCPLACFSTLHGTPLPHPECPLIESIETGQPCERVLNSGLLALRVSVYPLEGRTEDGHPLYLHLARPVAS